MSKESAEQFADVNIHTALQRDIPSRHSISCGESSNSTSYLGIVDWIGAFSPAGKLEFEAHAAALLGCIEADANGNEPRLTSAKRLPNQYVTRRPIDALRAGEIISDELPIAPDFKVQNRPQLTRQEVCYDLLSAQEDALPFRDLAECRPEVAEAITRYATCPPSVSFYVATFPQGTIVIPTSEVFMSCYFTSKRHLMQFFNGGHDRPFSNGEFAFNGYGYKRVHHGHVYCYPAKAARYAPRAEFEISQVRARAASYNLRSGDFAPLLIRPPFSGPVRISGQGLVHRYNGKTLWLFVNASFGPPRQVQARWQRPPVSDWAFAPRIFKRHVSLSEISADAPAYASIEERNCDVSTFSTLEASLADFLDEGRIHCADDSFRIDRDELHRLRGWLSRQIGLP